MHLFSTREVSDLNIVLCCVYHMNVFSLHDKMRYELWWYIFRAGRWIYAKIISAISQVDNKYDKNGFVPPAVHNILKGRFPKIRRTLKLVIVLLPYKADWLTIRVRVTCLCLQSGALLLSDLCTLILPHSTEKLFYFQCFWITLLLKNRISIN